MLAGLPHHKVIWLYSISAISKVRLKVMGEKKATIIEKIATFDSNNLSLHYATNPKHWLAS